MIDQIGYNLAHNLLTNELTVLLGLLDLPKVWFLIK